MPAVAVAGQFGVVHLLAIGRCLSFVLPAQVFVIVNRFFKVAGPVIGPQLAVEHCFYGRYRSIVQVGGCDPDTIERRGYVPIEGYEPGRLAALRKPTVTEPIEQWFCLLVGRTQKGICLDDTGRNEQVGVLAAGAIRPVAARAITGKYFASPGGKLRVDGGRVSRGLQGAYVGQHMAEVTIHLCCLSSVFQRKDVAQHHEACKIATTGTVVE